MGADSIDLAPFALLSGQCEFKRMPLWFSNASMVFQRVMSPFFGNIPYDKVFMDDTLVASVEEVSHAQHLRTIFCEKTKDARFHY